MPLPLSLKAPTKINLFLNLLGPRPDGFHEVRFVMQTLALADELILTPLGPGLDIRLTCSMPDLTTSDNLAIKAYYAFYATAQDVSPQACRVHLEKNIPVQAGLGGGSSDAAAMLKLLDSLHQNALTAKELQTLAAQLGSDVPFFLTGGTALATGRGEIISSLPNLPQQAVVLLKPKAFGISTPLAFQRVREANTYQEIPFQAWESFLAQPNTTDLPALLYNDFEAILFPYYPILAQAKETLLAFGLPGVLLSGSGPTLFGLLSQPDRQMAAIHQAFSEDEWDIFKTEFI